MKRSPRIRLSPDDVAELLAGRTVSAPFQGPTCPAKGESYPVTLQQPLEVRAVVTGSALLPRSKRKWMLTVELDRSEPDLLLNAESAGGVIVPMSGRGRETDPVAHGYVSNPGPNVLEAGAAVAHHDVETFSASQEAARRFAGEKVDVIFKRRAKSMSNRVHNALMQARAHGVTPDMDALEQWTKGLEEQAKEAAA
ncbi:MAG TPA: hypothetical protein VFN92_13385 [Solirubrobacterales bacterium]|nr:hypothetical protein [Solirubrobacterales bacterium]